MHFTIARVGRVFIHYTVLELRHIEVAPYIFNNLEPLSFNGVIEPLSNT